MNPDQLQARWRTSVHESAHAVAALRLGIRLDEVFVFGGGGGVAHTEVRGGIDAAIFYAAGPAAEILADHHEPPERPEPEGAVELAEAVAVSREIDKAQAAARFEWSDELKLRWWAIGTTERDPQRWTERLAWADREAEILVRRNEAAIVAVARELFARGRLTGAEIREILDAGDTGETSNNDDPTPSNETSNATEGGAE